MIINTNTFMAILALSCTSHLQSFEPSLYAMGCLKVILKNHFIITLVMRMHFNDQTDF